MSDDDNLSAEELENSEEIEDSPQKLKPRGPTTGKRSAKKKGPRHIRFDENDVPVGEWSVDFSTQMGVRARHIKITFKTWKEVPNGKKDTIWRHVKKKYNIKHDNYKEIVLRIVSRRFAQFKTRLRGIFIYKTRKPSNQQEELGDPRLIYKQISDEDWIEFVKQANDPLFKAKSDKARESQKENKCPHYMGRAGYAGKKEQWYEDEMIKVKESNPEIDPLALEEMVNECLTDRSVTWMKGHTPSSSQPPPLTQEMFDAINHWRGLRATGEFVPVGSEDVLVKATGKKEHRGRTRGVGGFVTSRTYFEKPKVPDGETYTKEEFETAKEELQQKFRVDMVRMMAEFASRNGWTCPETFEFHKKVTTPTQPNQEYSSCHSRDHEEDPFDNLEENVPCRLAIPEGDSLMVVAEGTVRAQQQIKLVHHAPLSQNNVHVSIDKCLYSSALLPIPNHGCTTVGEALGSFAQWPKKWVSLILCEDEAKDETSDKLKKKIASNKPKENASKQTKESRNKGKSSDDATVRSEEEIYNSKKSLDKRKSNESSVNKDPDVQNKKKHSENKAISEKRKNDALKDDRICKKLFTSEHDKNHDDHVPPLTQFQLTTVGPECERLEGVIVSMESNSTTFVKIDINSSVYNYKGNIVVHLSFVDLRQMFRNQWLNVSLIQVWGRFVYNHGSSIGVTEEHVGYMCPVELSSYLTNSTAMETYVTQVLKSNEDRKYIMGAFYVPNHWMMVVFCARENVAYILDSNKKGNNSMAIRRHLNLAWRVYIFRGGKHKQSSNELTIKTIECPQQPGDFECGYYVMKWMYDITVHYAKKTVPLEECISKSTVAAKDINRVREFWCRNFLDGMYI